MLGKPPASVQAKSRSLRASAPIPRIAPRWARPLPSRKASPGGRWMLKIVLIENGRDAYTLRLEGLVVGPWVEELGKACEQAFTNSGRLTLHLTRVSFVDRDGVDLFRRLRSRHVVLSNCSRFVEEQLKA